MRKWCFRVAVGGVSALLVLRDRALGRLHGRAGVTVEIASGGNVLDAAWLEPEGASVAVVVCHGIGETVEHWPRAQMRLADGGVASLVFNYSGFGKSSGTIARERCEQDAVAAVAWVRARFAGRVVVLGFSLGTGVAAAIAEQAGVDGLVLCEGYPSFREGADRMLAGVGWIFEDAWRTENRLRGFGVPVLVVHGEHDRLFPVKMGKRLAHACGGELQIVAGMGHSDLHARASEEDWRGILEWVVSRTAK